MSTYYYKYNFISPEPLYAIVKEELRSYIDTGAIDDTMWPIYTSKCLQKLGRGSYKILEWVLNIEDFKAKLPPDFLAVREAWMCTQTGVIKPNANAGYSQVTQTSTNLTPGDLYCDGCAACNNPEIIRLVYKTTKEVLMTFEHKYLLKPGNVSVQDHCSLDCKNTNPVYNHHDYDSFDIRDNKFVTNFRTGTVHLVYYSQEYTEDGYQMIPDNYRIKEFIELFIKQKMFEQLANQVTDETYNQIQAKADKYKAMADEAYIIAQIETKKQTIYQKHHSIIHQMHRNDKYNIR